MRELERTIRVINLPSGRKYFVVSRVRNQFFVEAFPQRLQSNRQEAVIPDSPKLPELPPKSPPTVHSGSSVAGSESSPHNQHHPKLEPSPPIAYRKKAGQSKRNSSSRHSGMSILNTDVLIITALPKERDALLKCKDLPGSPSHEWEQKTYGLDRTYYRRSFERDDGTFFNVATASAIRMGDQATSVTATRLATELNPRYLAMVGICAGNREDGNLCTGQREDGSQEDNIRLGDLIIADRVFDFECGKLKAYYDQRDGRRENIFNDIITYNLQARWVDIISNFSQNPLDWLSSITGTKPKSDEHQEYWLLHQVHNYRSNPQTHENPEFHSRRDEECPNWDKIIAHLWGNNLLVQDTLELTNDGIQMVERERLRRREKRDPLEPRIHLGPIGTSKKVIRDPKIFDYIKKVECKVLGIEMEGNAIGSVAAEFEIPMIIVKGVADYADHSKNNQFHQYAAEASARFLIAFLKKHLPSA